ncbi:MAG: O-methyltransferase [Bacteroidales bacterium]
MVNEKLTKYIEEHTTPESELLYKLDRETHLKTFYPRMLSGNTQGKFLEMISCMIRPEAILEIGTFTGYSAICLSRGLTETGVLHTIEINPEIQNISEKYIKMTDYSQKIKRYIGNALEVIPTIDETFDLVFIDADKENYLSYYKLVYDKVCPGGFILADNALWGGKVIQEINNSDKETRGILEFNDFIQNDNRVENVLVSLRDGIMMIRKKE